MPRRGEAYSVSTSFIAVNRYRNLSIYHGRYYALQQSKMSRNALQGGMHSTFFGLTVSMVSLFGSVQEDTGGRISQHVPSQEPLHLHIGRLLGPELRIHAPLPEHW